MLEISVVQMVFSFLIGVAAGKLLPNDPPAWTNRAIKHCAVDKMDADATLTPTQAVKDCTDELR